MPLFELSSLPTLFTRFYCCTITAFSAFSSPFTIWALALLVVDAYILCFIIPYTLLTCFLSKRYHLHLHSLSIPPHPVRLARFHFLLLLHFLFDGVPRFPALMPG